MALGLKYMGASGSNNKAQDRDTGFFLLLSPG